MPPHLYKIVTVRQQNSTPFLLPRPHAIQSAAHPTPGIMVCYSCSTAFWVILFAAFIVMELGVTAILVYLSTESPPEQRQR
jgi:hypothetical protein